MRLQDYDTMTRYKAKVLRSERITSAESNEEVREISIEVESPDFDAGVGQNIGVLAPGQMEIGQEHHFRLYSVADLPETTSDGNQRLRICVRRCSYIDEFSGEEYPGIASNYLCDLRPGETLTVTGPYGQVFELPQEHDATLILICAGTGIAPFRAFVKHIYIAADLISKAESGSFTEDKRDSICCTEMMKRTTSPCTTTTTRLKPFNALSKRPGWSDESDWGTALHARGEELCELLSDPKTYVYLAGLEKIRDELDDVLVEVAGSNQTWFSWKADLQAEGRWIELLY